MHTYISCHINYVDDIIEAKFLEILKNENFNDPYRVLKHLYDIGIIIESFKRLHDTYFIFSLKK